MASAGTRGRPGLRPFAAALVLALAGAACATSSGDPAAPSPEATVTASVAPTASAAPTTAPRATASETEVPSPGSGSTAAVDPDGVAHTRGVAHGPDPRQALDTYVPGAQVPSPTGDVRRRPAMVLVHGGGWTAGDRSTYHQMATALATRGWVAVTVGYRLAPAHQHPDAVDDVRAGLQLVHDRAEELGVDPARVVLAGDSAGGNLSGLVALADERPPVAAWVSWSGVHDFVALSDQLSDEHAWLRQRVAAYLGCEDPDAASCEELARAASPVTLASADDPPTLLVHSTDELVPLADAQAMHRALEDAGVRVSLRTFEGSSHGMQLQPRAAEDVEAFLADVLDLPR